MILKERKLFRIFIPRFPNFNVYTIIAKTTTSVGPLYVATSAAKLDWWDAEVIDENNLHGKFYPRINKGILDHQKLQKEDPADVVGFYGSITSSIPRLFELAEFYKSLGITTIAGGKHVENLPQEALHRGIDYIFFGESEVSIRKFLINFNDPVERKKVKGIGFLENNKPVKTPPRKQIDDLDKLPIPNYHLLRYGKLKLYPVVGTRGCNSNCEFCAVKDRARTCTPDHLLNTIKHLVEQYGATHFFEVSDHFASNIPQAIQFLNNFADYQKSIRTKLHLTVQTRITDARSEDYLKAIKKAHLDTLCIGFESPIDDDLKAMNKGYLSKDMLNWTKLFRKQKVRIHGMFIFAYPERENRFSPPNMKYYEKQYWDFIKRSKIGSLQLLLAIPLPGNELRKRLKEGGQLFPHEDIGWEYYDGQFPLYNPSAATSPEEILDSAGKLMKRFYHRTFLLRLVKNITLDFPLIVFPSVLTIVSGKVVIIKKAFHFWYRNFFQNNLLCFGGQLILRDWLKKFKKDNFLQKLKSAKKHRI